jgi:hypothetical protein
MKVFLSSTYIDLIEYRQAATEAIERLDQQVKRMEVFGARPEEPIVACFEEIKRCDIFIGIYAHRYGYILDGSEVSITEAEFDDGRYFRQALGLSKVSITEAEFDYAKANGKPLFCFLHDDNYPWPRTENTSGEDQIRLFRNKIVTNSVCDIYTTPENLAYKVATSIGRYLIESRDKTDAMNDDIPPLEFPFTKICLRREQISTSPLQLKHIILGKPSDQSNLIFDVTIANPSTEQILLTEFDVHWQYWHGSCLSTASGLPLKPVAKYIINLPINSSNRDEIHKSELIYPPIVAPPKNESGPSLTTLRLQMHYYFYGGSSNYEASHNWDWDVKFSLGILDEKGRLLQILTDMSWRKYMEEIYELIRAQL